MSKPCDQCPWLPSNGITIPAAVKGAVAKGQWIPCHKHMGDCGGAVAYRESRKRKASRS